MDEEYDTVEINKYLLRYDNQLHTTEARKYFCIGYLVAQGYAFTLAENLTETLYV